MQETHAFKVFRQKKMRQSLMSGTFLTRQLLMTMYCAVPEHQKRMFDKMPIQRWDDDSQSSETPIRQKKKQCEKDVPQLSDGQLQIRSFNPFQNKPQQFEDQDDQEDIDRQGQQIEEKKVKRKGRGKGKIKVLEENIVRETLERVNQNLMTEESGKAHVRAVKQKLARKGRRKQFPLPEHGNWGPLRTQATGRKRTLRMCLDCSRSMTRPQAQKHHCK